MIQLFQFAPLWGIPNASVFCLKVECYLRLAKIPYETKILHDPRGAPRGKLPFIKDVDTQEIITDSAVIIRYLKQNFGDVLDKDLTPEQQATTICLQRVLEDHLNWQLIHDRWADDRYWNSVKKDFFHSMPSWIQWLVPEIIRRNMKKKCASQGISLYTDEERLWMIKQNIDAIVQCLGNKPFLLKDSPSTIDCVFWAFLVQFLHTPLQSDLNQYAQTFTVLKDYDARMTALFQKAVDKSS